MDEPNLPKSPARLAEKFASLREARRRGHRDHPPEPVRRKALSTKDRKDILRKTAGRCHICGGKVTINWQADHVLAHGRGGAHSAENYLPAHRLCNNYRWDYLPAEFQWILKIGVWARTLMEKRRSIGNGMLEAFYEYEVGRTKRSKRVR